MTVQPATAEHLPAIIALIPELTAFGLPMWRSSRAVEQTTQAALELFFAQPPEGAAVFAALEGTELLGFIHVEAEPDFFDGTLRGYVSSIAVSKSAQGRGAGRALLEAAEGWARGRGYDYLALSVFAGNGQARGFYERLGFLEDNLKLYKPLK